MSLNVLKLESMLVVFLLIFTGLFLTIENEDPVMDSRPLNDSNNDINEKASVDPLTNSETSRAPVLVPRGNAHGGSWLDSFEDDSGIDWGLSDSLRLVDGDVLIDNGTSLDPNATGVWLFDEGSGTMAYDSSGNGNDGTLINGTSWTTGKYGKGLSFDGSNDYVDVSDSLSLDINNDISICSWVKLDNSWDGGWILCKNYNTAYGVYIYDDKRIEVYMDIGSFNLNWVKTATIVNLNEWLQIVAVYDSFTQKAYVYINGILDSNFPITRSGTIGTNNYPITIGKRYDGVQYFEGLIDEVAIYDRALSALEVKDVYENGTTKKFRFSNLTSKPITLPPNMYWDTLMIDKTEPEKTYINLTIFNASDNQPVPDSPTIIDDGEFDISHIDPIKYPSIRLNATFEGDGTSTPTLHNWGVSWNASDTWRDTLFGGREVDTTENVIVVDGNERMVEREFKEGAVGLWHFDEGSGTTVYDATDNNNDGTISGASWTTGRYGNALSFDGTDDYVDCNNAFTSISQSNTKTIMAWAKSDIKDYSSQLDENGRIITLYRGSGNSCFSFSARGNPATWRFIYMRSPNNAQWIDSQINVTEFQWTHLTLIQNNTNVNFYINGVMVNNLTDGIIPTLSSPPNVDIGGYWNGYDSFFDGIIDEVAIYNHALSPQEIKDLYENSSYKYESKGSLTSKSISFSQNKYWDTLLISKTEPTGTSLNVTVLDGISNEPITSFENLSGTEIDLSSINPIDHLSLKLLAKFYSNGNFTPILHDWSVNWTENTPPRIIDIHSNSTVPRKKSVTIECNLFDLQDPECNLSIQVLYKSPSDTYWQTDCLEKPLFLTNCWNCNFTPLINAELGFYSFKFNCFDSFQLVDTLLNPEFIEVVNNRPTEPNVTISPSEPTTRDNLTVIAKNSTDIETSYKDLEYWYKWYKDEVLMPEFENKTAVPGTATTKDEVWKCVVIPFDTEDVGDFGFAEVVIQSSPPELGEVFSEYLMFEDSPVVLEDKLLSMFIDPDMDKLEFSVSGQNNIDVYIFQKNGTIVLTPSKNWYGTENLTFYATDTYSPTLEQSVDVVVQPTNDLPQLVQIGNQVVSKNNPKVHFVVKQDEWVNLTMIVEDIDGDVERKTIKYSTNDTEQSNLNIINNQNKLVYHPLNEDVGFYYVTLMVTDNNETPLEYVSYDLEFEVLNINDKPSVSILSPSSGMTFNTTDEIIFSCEPEDPDLLIPNSKEWFAYEWYTDNTALGILGSEQQITVPKNKFTAGQYIVSVKVKDSGGEESDDSVVIVIKEESHRSESKDALSDYYLWLGLLIVVIVIILSILFIVISKRKKPKLETQELPKPEVLQPDEAYKPTTEVTDLPPASEGATPTPELAQPPTITEPSLAATEPSQEIEMQAPTTIMAPEPTPQLPPPTVELQPTVAEVPISDVEPEPPISEPPPPVETEPEISEPPQMEPEPSEQPPSRVSRLSSAQKLELLDKRLLQGEISEETYLNLKDKIELHVKQYGPPPQLPPVSGTEATEPAIPTAEEPAIETEPDPTEDLPPDAYAEPQDQPETNESAKKVDNQGEVEE